MFDLNTLISQALTQAVEQAIKPLEDRIRALETWSAHTGQDLFKRTGQLTRIFTHDAACTRRPWTSRLDQHVGHAAQLFTLQVPANEAGFLASFGL